jgi:hypothetical protein
VRFGRVVAVGLVVEAIGLLVAGVITLVGKNALSTPLWLLTPLAAVLAGGAKAAAEAAAGPQYAPGHPGAPPARQRGVSTPVAVLALILVVGVGGFGAAVGVRYAVGWLTGNESPVGGERLAAAPLPSDKSGRVTVTVTGVVDTAHFTRVTLTVVNREKEPATLTLYRNCVLTAGDVTLEADSFKSDWADSVPPGSTQKGTVTFSGHLPPGKVKAQMSFLRVFVFGRFIDDDSVVIKSIPLRTA